jgi:hypothetical protein
MDQHERRPAASAKITMEEHGIPDHTLFSNSRTSVGSWLYTESVNNLLTSPFVPTTLLCSTQ